MNVSVPALDIDAGRFVASVDSFDEERDRLLLRVGIVDELIEVADGDDDPVAEVDHDRGSRFTPATPATATADPHFAGFRCLCAFAS